MSWVVQAGPAQVSYVVHVSVDGLNAIYLHQALSNAPADYPTFMRLRREAAFTLNARCDVTKSETLPNHTCMITGRPVDQVEGQPETAHHGFSANTDKPSWTLHNQGNKAVPYIASVFDVVHDNGQSTLLVSGKEKFALYQKSYDATNGAADTVGEDNGKNKIDHALIQTTKSDTLVAYWKKEMFAKPLTYSFIHMPEPDTVGHAKGWGGSEWMDALKQVDHYLAQILETVKGNAATSNKTTVIITADHGGGSPTKTHVNPKERLNYTIPFFVYGPGWEGGKDLYSYFSNRRDPGTEQLPYSAEQQPIRNGDSGNLALTLLGLPSIPGSFIKPALVDAPKLP